MLLVKTVRRGGGIPYLIDINANVAAHVKIVPFVHPSHEISLERRKFRNMLEAAPKFIFNAADHLARRLETCCSGMGQR